jgi:four helix bundle protein
MARDHRRLRVFQEAHQLTLAIYKETSVFPREEWYGIRAQLRRAAVSVASNIVEGSARRSSREYVNFLNIAGGSAAETSYLIDLASELGYLAPPVHLWLHNACGRLIPQLQALIQSLSTRANHDQEPKA